MTHLNRQFQSASSQSIIVWFEWLKVGTPFLVTLAQVTRPTGRNTIFPGGFSTLATGNHVVDAEISGSEYLPAICTVEQIPDIDQMSAESNPAFLEGKVLGGHSHTGQLNFQSRTADPAVFVQVHWLDLAQAQESDTGLPIHHTEW